ncbi:hypothetical protein JCM33374_g5663 [Metschnikowia sp. JCM 33374]|nr:hypothetical protein JCM33374_g5663 [Metschnikowia sp. JCM 33374]
MFRKNEPCCMEIIQGLFSPHEPPSELTKLQHEVVDAAGIKDAMKIQNFICPKDENTAPISVNPSIPELIELYLPVYDEDEVKTPMLVTRPEL